MSKEGKRFYVAMVQNGGGRLVKYQFPKSLSFKNRSINLRNLVLMVSKTILAFQRGEYSKVVFLSLSKGSVPKELKNVDLSVPLVVGKRLCEYNPTIEVEEIVDLLI